MDAFIECNSLSTLNAFVNTLFNIMDADGLASQGANPPAATIFDIVLI